MPPADKKRLMAGLKTQKKPKAAPKPKMKVSKGPKVTKKIPAAKSPSKAPEGWSVVLKTRRSGATAGVVDKYYVSEKGQVTRSLIEVSKYDKGLM